MGGARARNLRGSLGESWGDAYISSSDEASIHSASSQSDDDDVATPLPPRVTRSTSQVPKDTNLTNTERTPTQRGRGIPRPVKTPTSTQSPRSLPRDFPNVGPSFIMPTMGGSANKSHTTSPLQRSRIRNGISTQEERQRARSLREKPQRAQREGGGGLENRGGYVQLFWSHVLRPVMRYFFDVIGYAMDTMKPFLGVLLSVLAVVFAIQYSKGVLQRNIQMALTPICVFPGSSYILPFCSTPWTATTSMDGRVADFRGIDKVQSSFEDVLEANRDAYALPARMKDGEIAVRDIRTLVDASRLPSRTELVNELTNFVETAKQASSNLLNYNSKVGATMDRVISTNAWTLQVLDSIAAKEASRGSLSRTISHLNPFSGNDNLEMQVFDQYVEHISTVKDEIVALIKRSQSLIMLLNHLDNGIDAITSIARRDQTNLTGKKDEVLAGLWLGIIGKGKNKIKDFDRSLDLLKNVLRYRDAAATHVGNTMQKLQEIEAELENLRDGVAAPEVSGYREGRVPLSVHIGIMGQSLERLREVRQADQRIEREIIGLAAKGEDRRGKVKELPAGKSK